MNLIQKYKNIKKACDEKLDSIPGGLFQIGLGAVVIYFNSSHAAKSSKIEKNISWLVHTLIGTMIIKNGVVTTTKVSSDMLESLDSWSTFNFEDSNAEIEGAELIGTDISNLE